MRVIMKYYNNANEGTNQTDPCETFAYGEVEDYTVNLFQQSLGLSQDELESVEVYPNPFTSDLDIKVPPTISGHKFMINIYDVLGRQVYSRQMELLNNNLIRISNLNSIQNGTYILTLRDLTTNQSAVKQVIKE